MATINNLTNIATVLTATDNLVLQTVGNVTKKIAVSVIIDTDTALAGNSDVKLASQKATKTYVDSKVTDVITNGVLNIAPSQNAVFDALALKQDTLVSATNIKTINGSSILGSGNLVVSGTIADGDKGDITVSASGATWTIDNGAITLAKQANMATASVVYRKTAGSGAPEVQTLATLKTDLGLTGTNSGDQTSIAGITGTKAQFDTAVTDGNFMYVGDTAATVITNANLTGHITSVGNATTLGSFTLAQLNTAVSDYNVASLGTNNDITLTATTPPSTTSSGTIALYANTLVNKDRLAIMDASGYQTIMQASFLSRKISYTTSLVNSSSLQSLGDPSPTVTGTAVVYGFSAANTYGRLKKTGAHSTTPSVNNIAGWRKGTLLATIGGSTSSEGGFFMSLRFALGIGVSNTGKRIFCGKMSTVLAPTEVEPSTLLNVIGVGCDASDTNFQFFNNDGSGTATKTDLGASFPVPLVDETSAYELLLYSPAGTSQIIYYSFIDLISGAIVSGSKTTDLPSVTTGLTYRMWMGSGANSREVGINFISMYCETNY